MVTKYKRNMNRRRLASNDAKKPRFDGLPVFIMTFFLFIGVVLGSISAVKMDKHEYIEITESIKLSFEGLSPANISKSKVFSESIFKNGRIVLIIWLVGFLSTGAVAALLIISYKGYGIGYTVSVFLMEYGRRGLLLSFGAFLIQNIALISICLFITYYYLHNMNIWLKRSGKPGLYSIEEIDITERLVILLISVTGVFIVGLYESYICPWICFLLF